MEHLPQSVAAALTFTAYLTGTTTPAEGKTIAVQVSKNKAAFTDLHGGNVNATEISSGCYFIDLDAVDLGTLGPFIVLGTEDTIDNVYIHGRVVNPHTLGADALPSVASGAAGSVARTTDGVAIPPAPAVVDANIRSINDVEVTGDGNVIPWGPT